jgi:hypothetical protein
VIRGGDEDGVKVLAVEDAAIVRRIFPRRRGGFIPALA